MTGMKFTLSLSSAVIFLWMATLSKGETEVTCVAMESCILPCRFVGGTDAVIYWFHLTPRYHRVHSFYQGQDQLDLQNEHFTGRTSMFKDQIPTGNASVQLTGVHALDEGRYRCFTNAGGVVKVSQIHLKVDHKRGI